jgi:hypothetical protein
MSRKAAPSRDIKEHLLGIQNDHLTRELKPPEAGRRFDLHESLREVEVATSEPEFH